MHVRARPSADPQGAVQAISAGNFAIQTSGEVRGDKSGKVNTRIIIRADKNSTYLRVFELMVWCRDADYRKIERAYIKAEG